MALSEKAKQNPITMKVLFIVRSTLYSVCGGDTQQIVQTALQLQQQHIAIDIKLTNEEIDYSVYDLLHFFNVIRPADIVYHVNRSNKPFVISPILIDYTAYDKNYRKGVAGFIFQFLSANYIEYIKTIARWIKRKDHIRSRSYFWKGQKKSIEYILNKTSGILSTSAMEYDKLSEQYHSIAPNTIVPNGIDPILFSPDNSVIKDPLMVLCVGRIEGIKNQLNLIKAVNNSKYKLVLIGNAAPNQQDYYQLCKKSAGPNVIFIDHIPQENLLEYYKKAKVHILPSWFEVCGLSSLEAAAMGCNIVITDKGFTREYFHDLALYCDPGSPENILETIDRAANLESCKQLQQRISDNYSWKQSATKTAAAYKSVLQK